MANITADIKYRPQDVGTTGSVYVFALAPATQVMNAEATSLEKHIGPVARGRGAKAKDTPVACVLAQLNQSGQLQAVSASSLGAYVSGVLGAQGQAVQIVNAGEATGRRLGDDRTLGEAQFVQEGVHQR